MVLIETPDGFVLANKSMKPVPGDKVTFQLDEFPQLSRLFKTGIITSDSETIDGEGMDGIFVPGKVKAGIVSITESGRPII